ncbi:uncharacterized protein An08g12080 [Aspergillus niger]|uniref:Contig An08c0330, genomic contig n=2 Tax=Aspergillus niger TaxID=5061 RepID=A2QSV6_ASPNC|nr:uncharacterized protein An08g12080 [Aspergillus niger]CAK40084.1 unnamed protein product [Aspergillus niger]
MKSDVLMRAQQGEFIRYHILSTEQEIISPTYRTSCMNMLNVTVGLDEQGPGAMPLILEEKQSRKVASVGYGLEKAGFVDCFELPARSHQCPQPILSPPSAPCLPISKPKSSISADPLLADVVNSWMNDTHDNSHFLNGEAKQLWDVGIIPESALYTPPDTTLLTSCPGFGISSPTETISTPVMNGTTPCYSTPSTMGSGSSPGGKLADVRPTSRELLRSLLDGWDNNMSLGLHALGLPVAWKGIQGMVNYLRDLDADEKNTFLDPDAKRIAMVLLYINYEEPCTNHDRYWPALKKKRPSSHVITCTLQAYHDDPCKSKSEKSRRDQISASYAKCGRLWWILAGTLGVGILSQFTHVSSKDASFNEDKINALVTLVLNTHSGTICTFHELEPVVKSLMFGQVTEGLRQAILNDEIGIFGRRRMAHTQAENAAAIARQRTENPWTNVDAKHIAMENMAKFLTNVL